MKIKKMHLLGIFAGILIMAIGIIFFNYNEQLVYFLIGIGFFVIIMPFVIEINLQNQREQKINDMFLEFTRNLAESVAAGTPISRSIINMSKKNYGVLTPHVVKLANQIEIGIPVGKALSTFAEDVGSPVIKRAIALIREAERAGGEIEYILNSTAKSISEVEKLKKERKAAISNLVVQGYIIFFIFIGIVLVVEYRILPLMEGLSDLNLMSGGTLGSFSTTTTVISKSNGQSFNPAEFVKPFLYLLVTQGFFAGLVIGKISEGSIRAGIKHSFIMAISAFLIATGVNLFLGAPGGAN